jgi:Uma2 family endonuclease
VIQPLTTAPEAVGDEDALYEIVNGEKVAKRMSTYENVLAGELHGFLREYVRANRLGRAVVEVMFDLPDQAHDLRPDVAFVSYDRWPQARGIPRTNAWPVVPDLAVEVVSPNDDMRDVIDRVGTYFDAGARMVWLVVPGRDLVYVHTSLTQVRMLARGDELTGDPVVPGFRMPVADLFPPADPPEPTAS